MDEAPVEVLRAAARGCPSGLLGKLACASKDLRDACLAEARIRAEAAGAYVPERVRLPPVSLRLLTTADDVDWALSRGVPADRLARALVEGGRVAALARAVELGAPLPPAACALAAAEGRLETLEWLAARGAPLDAWVCASAARGGSLEALRWARRKGCPWLSDTCAYAARGGHLEVLKWARDNGAPWDATACAFAAAAGRLDVLEWARDNGAPWDHQTCFLAARHGRLDVLKWAVERGAPGWHPAARRVWLERAEQAERRGHRDVADWLRRELR